MHRALLSAAHLLVAAGASQAPGAAAESSTSAAWVQNRFVISFWVDPIVPPERFPAEYARIADANFTAVLGGFGAKNPATVAQSIAAATAAGLASIPSICGGACANLTGAWIAVGKAVIQSPPIPPPPTHTHTHTPFHPY